MKTAAKQRSSNDISTVEAAKRLGMTKQAIGQWCAQSGAPVRKDGTRVYVRWPDFARWREERLVANAKGEGPVGSATARRLLADARNAEIAQARNELALARELGEVVSIADYEAALGLSLDRVMARLRGLPARLAYLGPDAETAVESEIEEVIKELNGFDEDVLEEPQPDEQERAE